MIISFIDLKLAEAILSVNDEYLYVDDEILIKECCDTFIENIQLLYFLFSIWNPVVVHAVGDGLKIMSK